MTERLMAECGTKARGVALYADAVSEEDEEGDASGASGVEVLIWWVAIQLGHEISSRRFWL